MDINTWQSILDVEDQQEIRDAADKAEQIGKERFGEVILEITDRLIRSEEFSALVSALVVGNVAFDAAAIMELEMSDDITLTVRLDRS